MTDELKALADRIAAVEARLGELSSFLHSAVGYLSSDPPSSLTKSRVILEKVLLALYRGTMKKEPPRPMIGDMLADKAFMVEIPRRILARMNAIRDMSNLGAHDEEVHAIDAIRVMRDLIEVLEWYVVHPDPSCQVAGGPASATDLGSLAAAGADCRVFLGRGVSGREGWGAFARILVRQLVELGCVSGWDIVVKVRTAEEDELTATNEYGDEGKDLVSDNVDAGRRLYYSVSLQEVDDMNLLWDEDCRAEAAADMIITQLMTEEGLLDNDERSHDDWASTREDKKGRE